MPIPPIFEPIGITLALAGALLLATEQVTKNKAKESLDAIKEFNDGLLTSILDFMNKPRSPGITVQGLPLDDIDAVLEGGLKDAFKANHKQIKDAAEKLAQVDRGRRIRNCFYAILIFIGTVLSGLHLLEAALK